jgi:hypothetical protein
VDPRLLDSYADEITAIQAEEDLRAIHVAIFSSPAQTDADVQWRKAYIAKLQRMAQGSEVDSSVDEYGRQVLRTYDEVRAWMDHFTLAA